MWNEFFLLFVTRLVFSQSLISLDLIEDFLELSCKDEQDEDAKPSPYKGSLFIYVFIDWLSTKFLKQPLRIMRTPGSSFKFRVQNLK